jgi:hypothetical protein
LKATNSIANLALTNQRSRNTLAKSSLNGNKWMIFWEGNMHGIMWILLTLNVPNAITTEHILCRFKYEVQTNLLRCFTNAVIADMTGEKVEGPYSKYIDTHITLYFSYMENEKHRLVKQRLRECIQENDKLYSKLQQYKYRNLMLETERSHLLKRLQTIDSAPNSSDSEEETLAEIVKKQESSDPFDSMQAKDSVKTPKIRRVQQVPRNPDGSPILPFPIGVLSLHSLGKISFKPGFHSDKYVYPVGFCCSRYESLTREYHSYMASDKTTDYTCTILDGDHPVFQIIAKDDPQNIIVGNSASGAWAQVVKLAGKLRNKNTNSVSGPEYFGFGNPTVMSLLQELPEIQQLAGFKAEKVRDLFIIV